MSDREIRQEADDLIVWASCVLAALRFPKALEGPLVGGDADAAGLMASGLLAFLQAPEHLESTRRIGYARRVAQFVQMMHRLDPVVDFGALAAQMSRAESSDEAVAAKQAMGTQIAGLRRPDRERLLHEYKDFSRSERATFLTLAKSTLEAMRDLFAAHGSVLADSGIDGAIVFLAKRIDDEEGEEPGGNVTADLPQGPPPQGPLVGREPLPGGGFEDPDCRLRHARPRERELAGAAGTAATQAA